MIGTRLSPASSQEFTTERYNLNDIPPGDEGISEHFIVGQLTRQMSTQDLQKDIGFFSSKLGRVSSASQTQNWCLAVVRDWEANAKIEPGSVANICSHPYMRDAVSIENHNPVRASGTWKIWNQRFIQALSKDGGKYLSNRNPL